jgi:membrane-associated PAP2 superfamily phosphatase
MNTGGKWLFGVAAGLALAWPSSAAPVDQTAAETVARGWLNETRPHLAAKLHPQIKATESFSGFYVVHLAPEGFLVVPADDELEPVLAFSDRGTFSTDPDNPLWILLNRDVPARAQHLHEAKAAVAPATGEDPALSAAKRANAKWAKYKTRGLRLATTTAPLAQSLSAANDPAAPAGVEASNLPAAAVAIRDVRLVDGHIQLTHDASSSVSIYASYDGGQTWTLEDSSVVWPTWTTKQPVAEAGCWYRVVSDGLYDEMTVSLMRNPPPVASLPDIAPDTMTNVFAPQPTGPGTAGSVGTVSDLRVSPLLQSTWNQSSEQGVNCFNYYTPNNYVDGCVATALSQLMRYWQYPTAGIGQISRTVYVDGTGRSATTRGGDGAGGAYNWSAMPLSPSTAAYNLGQWQMIGALCYDAGVSVNMQYSSSGSGAYMYLCAGALTSVFQYANAKYVSYPSDLLTPTDAGLAAGCPVLFGISSSGSNGHAVVCDGFGYDSGTLYHHINLGWDGYYNAWYALPNLETPYNFNTIDTIIYNVFPSGTGELLTGRVTTPQGAPVAGASITATAGGVNYSATSDSKGYYGIKVPSARTYSVTAAKAGMGSATQSGVTTGTSSTSASGDLTSVNFTLNNNFSFTAVGLTNSVWLRWSAPTSSGLPNNTVYIRTRTDHFPTSSSDGTLVYTGNAQAFEHTGVDSSGNVTNYYTIWGNNGSAYASLGANANASGLADPGTVRLLWTRASGEVVAWNLRANGTKKSSAYVNTSASLVDPTYWTMKGFADIDRDGVADILWTGAGGEVVYWLLNADGTLKSAGRVYPGNATASGYWTVAGFADIDGDGTADILWTGAGGEVVYWLLNPDGTRKSAGRVAPGNATASGYWTVAGFGDINRDGTPDILWTGAGGEVVYWLLNADGTRKSAGRVAPGNATASGYWTVAGFGDINRDGTADILWTGAGGEVVYWLLNADGTRNSAGRVYPGNATRSGYWSPAGFKDINHDGTADIVWRGQAGETRFWLLNPDGTFNSTALVDPALIDPTVWSLRAAGNALH